MEAEGAPKRSLYKTLHCLIYEWQQRGSKVRFVPSRLCSPNTAVDQRTQQEQEQSFFLFELKLWTAVYKYCSKWDESNFFLKYSDLPELTVLLVVH